MELNDYSFILGSGVLFLLSMLIIITFYLILRKRSYKSGFWCYSMDFPQSKKYWKR